MYPKISIVTPSYNQGQFLEQTILSILNQHYPNLEYIIIDGGSTDNAVDIIKKYEKHLTYWVTEPDQGQTHAINKGFKMATGEIVNWVNSDDLLEPDSLLTLAHAMEKDPNADVYFGDYRAIDGMNNFIYVRKSAPYHFRTLLWGRQLSCQPAVFFRCRLLERFGYLDQNKNFCMDTEFWIRIASNGVKFRQIKTPIGITRVHIDAKTTRLQQQLHNEHKEIVWKYNALKRFTQGSKVENAYFLMANRFWRIMSAVNRMIFRKDFSFLQASKALTALNRE